MKCVVLAAGLIGAAVLAASAFAQANVVVADALADAVLATSGGALHKDQMRIFARAALSDGKLAPYEVMFFETARDRTSFVTEAGGKQQTFTVDADAQALAGLVRGPVDLNALWNDPKGFTQFSEIASWGAFAESRAITFIAGKLTPAMSASRLDNGYAPFRDELSRKKGEIDSLPADERRPAQRLLFLAARKVGRAADAPMVTWTPMSPSDWEDADEPVF